LAALFVHRTVMSATQHREIRQLRRPAMCPVPNMVSLSKRQAAAWEATALVAMLKRAPQRGGNRAGSGADFCNPSIGIVPHHRAAGVACEAMRRSRGNAGTALEHRLPWRIDFGQHRGIDVNDDLVALTRRAGLHSTVQGGRRRRTFPRERLSLADGVHP
jgi:hypothetical protein